ncbi:MAG: ferredoxin [Planctomycetes bacterium]|nr:ferredoxin [Planctomycetota bacterium]
MTPTDQPPASELRALRRWHLGSGSASPVPADALPLLLAPYRDAARVRHDYPLVLTPAGDGIAATPLGDRLQEWAGQATAQPRILQDNLQRLERRVRLAVGDGAPQPARELLRAAGEQMLAEMQLRPEIAAGVRSDLDAMLPSDGAIDLLGLHRWTALHLFVAAARDRVGRARERFAEVVRQKAEALRQLLAVEDQKDPKARAGAALQKSLGGGTARFFDSEALSKSVGKHRGTVSTDPERLQRLRDALATLDGHLGAEAMPELVLAHRGPEPLVSGVSCQQSTDVCAGAVARFDHDAKALLPVVRAVHLAELELRRVYDAERHDPMLAAMDWRDLSADEMHALPVVVALAPTYLLAGHEMQALTGLLTSGRPVHVLVQETPAHDPAHSEGGHGNVLPARSRLELGYLGIAFRDAYVQQTTAARPGHLLRGILTALGGTRPGLHVVDSGLDVEGRESPLGAFLHAGAAIEGRAHPLFQYDPEAGDTWARRLDFSLNPSPDTDWPASEHALEGDGNGEGARQTLHFTFADYALLDPHLRDSFALAPDGLGGGKSDGDLVELAAYLDRPEDEVRHCIPFVWISTARKKNPQRAVVRRSLVDACRDRRRFWRTLQELAGVRNDYVREAVQRARQEAAEQAAREREALAEKHQLELEAVRGEAAGTAMQGLARMLLELDPLAEMPASIPRPVTATGATTAAAEATEAETAATPEPEPIVAATADDEADEEAWIESVRCSTCNDCINMNSLLFVYNENKQARIGDPKAGTYAQLVQAAEKCPSRCIHPGKPQNPDEPDLEELIARAALFN